MKWGTLYGSDYVNVLFSAVRRNLSGRFRFVCLTDESEGVRPEVECLPIPDIGLLDHHWRSGAWPKIGVFSHHLHGLSGRALFIDLDMMIVGDLTDFFVYGAETSDLVAINEGAWSGSAPSTMSSIFAFDVGRLGHLVDDLRTDREVIIGRYGLEQRYLHNAAGRVMYWPDEWLVSFKRHLRRPLVVDRLLHPKTPANPVRVVVFHGEPRPIDIIRTGGTGRDRFPRFIRRPVPWAREYWLQHGGQP